MVRAGSAGPVVVRASSRRRSSAVRRSGEVNTAVWRGRNMLVPSARRSSAGTDARSGGVSWTDCASAASTTRPRVVVRSRVVAKRTPASCREVSACRFHRRQVDRRSPTTATTCPAIPATVASDRLSAANSCWPRLPSLTSRAAHTSAG